MPNNLPHVTLKWSQTLDGQLADDLNQSQWISGLEERIYTHELRAQHQAVAVGAQTYLKDRCQLTVRDARLSGPQPSRVIFDPRGRVLAAVLTDETYATDLTGGGRPTYLICDVPSIHNNEIVRLREMGLTIITQRFDRFDVWLARAIERLALEFEQREGRALRDLMVEGGATLLAQLLKAELADRIEVSISPLILGGRSHRLNLGKFLRDAPRYIVREPQQLGVDFLLRYEIARENRL